VKIVIFGLSVTSAWGNGHATTFRALASALWKRGHRIVFFERDQEWYASNRDLPQPGFCDVRIYPEWGEIVAVARRELRDADISLVGSYFPDGIAAVREVLDSRAIKTFYDIDTPITLSKLRNGGAEYLRTEDVPSFDLYFSFTGGPALRELESKFGARRAVPLYCSFDPDQYHVAPLAEYACDLSYMGTYAADRQQKIETFLCQPARTLTTRKFIVAGSQYPEELPWPANVRRIIHLNPRWHASFYSSSLLTLNVTRHDMVRAGYSPSVRLFEAAACGATIVSDSWEGIDKFLRPGREILLPTSSDDVIGYLNDMARSDLRRIGRNAQERVLAEHTSQVRAIEFENYVSQAVACAGDVYGKVSASG
jgi:spore maturation protein CgeB